ncbi:hypothetical protein I308_104401 [Cryptococcus tetragattii IND107]|uniref:WW domain-containing protein n=1 Tax=Cryptococcus tetragattii IND107 TaxID=1296105 RepID=A0ABR3BQ95_9TREE
MPSDPPPPYQPADASSKSNLQTTAPQGATQSASAGGNAMQRSPTNMSGISDTSTEGTDIDLNDELRDMDDEQRDLPPGWVRCFDPKQQHHFYVDEATKRSTWVHPYDDPEYLRTLPKDHPAHPDSKEARAVRKYSEDEELSKRKRKEIKSVKGDSKAKGTVGTSTEKEGNDDERNWFQRKKDKLIGTKEEREKAKAEKKRLKEEQKKRIQEQEEAYRKRRKELIDKQLNDPMIRSRYAANPYMYSAPAGPFMRNGLYSSPYGFGYGGGYGRRGYYGGLGGMGMGMPLMMGGGAGLLGGMLLADSLDGGYGGGYGGGDMGGGDMGGGDMGGGGGF